ncbi:MAG: NAD(P)H-dependent oxidoreductase [Patescibacteria group bacterium]
MIHKIAVIIGSTRPSRVGDKVAEWYVNKLANVKDAQLEIIDLLSENLPFLNEPSPASSGQYSLDRTKKWSEKIDSFDAFVWVTPEYNHSAPASLTNAISYLNKEWQRKPVALVSYGSMGGVRAAEHLRAIAGELYMADIRPQVAIRLLWEMFDDAGDIRSDLIWGDPKEQINELLWRSDALKSARQG